MSEASESNPYEAQKPFPVPNDPEGWLKEHAHSQCLLGWRNLELYTIQADKLSACEIVSHSTTSEVARWVPSNQTQASYGILQKACFLDEQIVQCSPEKLKLLQCCLGHHYCLSQAASGLKNPCEKRNWTRKCSNNCCLDTKHLSERVRFWIQRDANAKQKAKASPAPSRWRLAFL